MKKKLTQAELEQIRKEGQEALDSLFTDEKMLDIAIEKCNQVVRRISC